MRAEFFVRRVEVWGNADQFEVCQRIGLTVRRVAKPFKSREAADRDCVRRKADWQAYEWAMANKWYPKIDRL